MISDASNQDDERGKKTAVKRGEHSVRQECQAKRKMGKKEHIRKNGKKKTRKNSVTKMEKKNI